MILRSAPASPYGRKVKISASLLGLMEKIEVVNADTNDPSEQLRQQNPLGKIPTLVLADGTALYDSRVICEYLDHLAGGARLIPADAARFPQLVLQALADGQVLHGAGVAAEAGGPGGHQAPQGFLAEHVAGPPAHVALLGEGSEAFAEVDGALRGVAGQEPTQVGHHHEGVVVRLEEPVGLAQVMLVDVLEGADGFPVELVATLPDW